VYVCGMCVYVYIYYIPYNDATARFVELYNWVWICLGIYLAYVVSIYTNSTYECLVLFEYIKGSIQCAIVDTRKRNYIDVMILSIYKKGKESNTQEEQNEGMEREGWAKHINPSHDVGLSKRTMSCK